MKKVLFLTLILVSALFAQDEVITWNAWTKVMDSTRVTLTDADTAYIWVSFPNQFDYVNNTSWPIIIATDVSTKPSNLKIPFSGENFFNGNFYVGIYPETVGNIVVDSLQIRWSPYDNLGEVFTNDIRYLDFSTGTSGSTIAWYTSVADGGAYGASSNGEAVNTCGLKFTVIQHDTNCVNTLDFKIFKN